MNDKIRGDINVIDHVVLLDLMTYSAETRIITPSQPTEQSNAKQIREFVEGEGLRSSVIYQST